MSRPWFTPKGFTPYNPPLRGPIGESRESTYRNADTRVVRVFPESGQLRRGEEILDRRILVATGSGVRAVVPPGHPEMKASNRLERRAEVGGEIAVQKARSVFFGRGVPEPVVVDVRRALELRVPLEGCLLSSMARHVTSPPLGVRSCSCCHRLFHTAEISRCRRADKRL
jgi:hypothetical protein